MSTTLKDGGTAFPAPHSIDGNWVREPLAEYRGMSLRDYFAGQALVGSMASDTAMPSNPDNAKRAAACYEIADAMLKARENKA